MGPASYKCSLCPKLYTTPTGLHDHIGIIHNNEKYFGCAQCGKRFGYSSDLKKHVASTHSTQEERRPRNHCPKCSANFLTKASLQSHLHQRHTPNPTFACGPCGKSFATKSNLQRHKSTHNPLPPEVIVCPKCPRIPRIDPHLFKSTVALARHDSRVHGQKDDKKLYECDGEGGCGKKFTTKSQLSRHRKGHLDQGTSSCHFCHKEMSTLGLARHVYQAHTKVQEQETCPVEGCGKSFSKKYKLKYHIKSAHFEREKTFWCIFCGKKFKTVSEIYQHLRSHLGERAFWCEFCEKRVSTHNHVWNCKQKQSPEWMAKKMKKKSTIKSKFCCPLCSKELTGSLNKHVSVHHFKEKWYKCKICHKRFGCRVKLQRHRLTHGRPDVNCYFCGKSYKTRSTSALFQHMRIHCLLGKEDFPCPRARCGKILRSSALLERHIELRHERRERRGPRIFSCTGCSNLYQSKSALDAHFAIHHSIQPTTYPCPTMGCFKVLVSKSRLDLHLETHKTEAERVKHVPFVTK